MSDADLVKELRQQARNRTERFGDGSESVTAEWRAADRIEALAAEVERLKAERVSHVDYSADLQRIIECICHKRTIRTPITTARYHFDLAVKYRAEAESAERALAEAVSHLNATLPYMLGEGPNGEKAAARDFITAQEKEKGK